jgi:hypothetical protein
MRGGQHGQKWAVYDDASPPHWADLLQPGGKRKNIQVTATMRILVAIDPVDLRKYAPFTNRR